MSSPIGASIAELGRALRQGRLSSVELLDRSARSIQAQDGHLNAFVSTCFPQAHEAARAADLDLSAGRDRGPLHGIPVAVKDLVDVAGSVTSCGSRTSFGGVATRDAEVVARLLQAGAIVVGKTTLHEFAYGATGDRSAHGASRNPYDPSRISGGSSGGSAVAVAADMVPLAIGTDTVGSVRVPAALCGVVGFKPAYGVLSDDGIYPLAPSLDHVGLLGDAVDDVRLAYEALTGEVGPTAEPFGEGIRAAVLETAALAPVDPRVSHTVAAVLAQSGMDLEQIRLPTPTDMGWFEASMTIQGAEAFGVHRRHLHRDRRLIDPEVMARLEAGGRVTPETYEQARGVAARLREVVDTLLQHYDVLTLPTVPVTAPPIEARTVRVADQEVETRAALLSLTHLWNLTGLPAISVPAGSIDALPVGAQILTAPGRESALFSAAHRVEQARSPLRHQRVEELTCRPSR